MRFVCLTLVWLALAVPSTAQSCPAGPTALVLSGGGVKGLAHLGVLRALDRLGATPDFVVGTSMGAIIGALYSSGYSAGQIDSLLHDLPITDVVRPFRPPAPHPWNRRIPALFLVKGHRGFTFQTGIVDEAQPNARLNDALLRGNLLARGRFDQLPIPFHAVATDLRNRKTVVLDTGDLARAVRASSSIPLVFPPVVAGEAVLVDGGLSANIPVAEARQLGAARVIVSDVTEYPRDTLDFESPLALADQLLGFLFQQTTAERRRGDIWIRPDVQSYRSLDFSPETIATILRRGELAADSTIGRAACLPQRIRNESDFPATTGPWQVTTADRRDSLLLARHLGLSRQGRLDETALRRGLLALAEAEAVRGVWLNPGGRGDSVTLSLEPLTAPVSVGGLGLAYDHELGGRAWAGWFDRRALGTPAEASVLLTLGRYQRELVVAGLAHVDPGMSRLTPIVTVHLLAEDVRQFDDAGIETRAAATREGRVAAGVEFRPGIAWRIRLQAEAIRWSEPGASSSVLGGSLETSARSRGGKSITMEALWAGASARFRVAGEAPMIRTGRTTTVASGRLGWGRALPLRWTLPLGGDAGFPGLHLGERRGFAETMAAVRFGYRAIGPLEARVFAAAGRVWTDARSPGPWLGGARIGIGTDTPLGPVEAAIGVNTEGRSALYLRLGQWF